MDLNRDLWSLVVAFFFLFTLVRIVIEIWWKPLRMKKYFESQGISGPPYRLLYGNTMEVIQMMEETHSAPMELSHDILSRVLPEINSWTYAYGKNFVYWFGPVPRIVIPQPELIRDLLCIKSTQNEKPEPASQVRQLLGDGLATSRGEKWTRQRRLISPAFHAEALKSMVPEVVASAVNLLEKWDQAVASGTQEIEVLEEFRNLTADVIARTAFGSSYREGKHIFDLQTEQAILVTESFRNFLIPGYRFLPTRGNLKGRRLDREIQRSLRQIITDRQKNAMVEKGNPYGKDLLGLMMAANCREIEVKKHLSMSFQDMIDECKTFFVAGHETTSILLAWAAVLLAMHTEWQELARKEVMSVCKNEAPNAEDLSRLKTVNMVLHEVLRLYPPIPFMVRRTCESMKLGSLTLPKSIEVTIPIAAVHHDKDLWGEDANEFNPQRFSEGVSKAVKHPMAFMPFGLGPRICVGMNFSMIEAKVVLAMILQRFSFALSPAYAHAPVQNFTIRPQHGAQLILHRLSCLCM